MPFLQGMTGAERLRQFLPTVSQAHERAQRRRERVLEHDWAKRRLCAVLQLERAEQWNGYVPAATDGERPNDDPARKALIQLLREVDECDRRPE